MTDAPNASDSQKKSDKRVCLRDHFLVQNDEVKTWRDALLPILPADIRDVVPLIVQYLQFQFEHGVSLDVLDTREKYYESEIMEVREDTVFIRYKGWSPKWDEWIPKTSERLAPVNHYTNKSLARNGWRGEKIIAGDKDACSSESLAGREDHSW